MADAARSAHCLHWALHFGVQQLENSSPSPSPTAMPMAKLQDDRVNMLQHCLHCLGKWPYIVKVAVCSGD